jgi:hypothetical protein
MDVSTTRMSYIPAEVIAMLQAGNKDVFNAAIAEAVGRAEAECRIFDFLQDHLAKSR